ncbi:MAG: hypothetical protein CUN53_20860, partial [Phototrophicales bacterium]
SRRQADRLIAAAEVVDHLRPTGLILPKKENHILTETDVIVLSMDETPDLLAEHEARIERGLKAFYEVGESLRAIRDARLYREFKTFEDYCEQRWHLSRRQADRLIAAAEVVDHLRPTGLILPKKENHI